MLLIHKQGLVELPAPLLEKDWKDSWEILKQYSELLVLDVDQEI